MKKFGAEFITKLGRLPIRIKGTEKPSPIFYNETKGLHSVKVLLCLQHLILMEKQQSKQRNQGPHWTNV